MKCFVCDKEYPVKSKWDSIRAWSEGWFSQKDGASFCPDHTPEWLTKWRLGE